MRRRIFISILSIVALSLAACGAQETTPLPTTVPATSAPAITEPLPMTDTPVAAPTAAPTQASASGGDTSGSDSGYNYDYGYGSDATPSSDGMPVTGGSAIQSRNGPLGPMLVDASGRTLYVFLKDTQNANTSACSALCAGNWPALSAASAGAGVNASLLGSFQRNDGTTQATYNGWPLYYFAQDQNPGDINGQGISGNWYVLSPSGEVVK